MAMIDMTEYECYLKEIHPEMNKEQSKLLAIKIDRAYGLQIEKFKHLTPEIRSEVVKLLILIE
jgi:hypothetical protein